ncbi:MAG TPA: DUF2461 domain-containing protein [Saprospiraceae bacterium]|nr:DUF2461 domain-containing protein [Saprospiraceae bacterium]
MNKRKIYQFLRDLSENNSKEWMDENRERYHEAKEIWLEEISNILKRLSKHDAHFTRIKPKDTIMRINNNRMFHPDRPVYKDNFGFSPPDMEGGTLYLHVSPKESWIGGGLYRPDNDILKSIRAAIDYDGEKLLEIIHADSFQDFFGGLTEDDQKLKTSPQGYTQDHRHIELMRRKNFAAIHPLTQKEVVGDDLVDIVERAYLELKPLNDYFERALLV